MRRALAIAGLALTVLGCPSEAPKQAGETSGKKDALDSIKERGTLVIALNAGYPPFEVMGDDGKPVGFDVDFAGEVAKDLGVKLEIKNVKWDGIIPVLLTGKSDAIFSGMSVTEERKDAVLFSEPYFNVGQVVIKRKGDDRIKSHTDLNDPTFTIAVEQSTTGEQACRKSIPKATLLRFEKVDQACMALIQKKADAVVFDNAFLMKYVKEREKGDLEGIWTQFTFEDIAVAVRKSSPRLKAAVDGTLKRLEASGELSALRLKHFGVADAPGK